MVELAVRRARSWEGTFGNARLYGRERDQLYVLNEDDLLDFITPDKEPK